MIENLTYMRNQQNFLILAGPISFWSAKTRDNNFI